MQVTIEWENGQGPDDFADAVEEFAETVHDELLDEFEPMMESIREEVQNLAPVDTGKLRDSYEEDVERLTDRVRGRVGTDVEYAPFQEFLEFGIEHLAPGLELAKDILENHVEKAWNRAVKEVS